MHRRTHCLGYLALITFIIGSILWSALIAHRRQEICSRGITVYLVAYWAIPLTWTLLVYGLAFTVNDWRRRYFSLDLSVILMMAISLPLRVNLNNTCDW
jgi:ABC-type dipeptide/oligopeptide/nickel transport system permease component